MLIEVMRHIRNFFPTNKYEEGEYEIKDGTISLSFISEGQYFLIEGSVSNDGVYKYPATDMTDETFTGVITLLAPPKAFIDLVSEIETFNANAGVASPYASESFGGYSYTRATNSSGNYVTWQDVYKNRLDTWRKL